MAVVRAPLEAGSGILKIRSEHYGESTLEICFK